MTLRKRFVVPVLISGLAITAFCFGCEISRFPICRSNSDCKVSDDSVPSASASSSTGEAPHAQPHPVCYNLRCVQCHYDSDCGEGNVCTALSECHPLDGAKPSDGVEQTNPPAK